MITWTVDKTIQGERINLTCLKDEHGNIGLTYTDDKYMHLGSPWQYITDQDKTRIADALHCVEAEAALEGGDEQVSDLKVVFERSSKYHNLLVEVLEDASTSPFMEYVVLLSSDTDDEVAVVRLTKREEAERVAEALLAAVQHFDPDWL